MQHRCWQSAAPCVDPAVQRGQGERSLVVWRLAMAFIAYPGSSRFAVPVRPVVDQSDSTGHHMAAVDILLREATYFLLVLRLVEGVLRASAVAEALPVRRQRAGPIRDQHRVDLRTHALVLARTWAGKEQSQPLAFPPGRRSLVPAQVMRAPSVSRTRGYSAPWYVPRPFAALFHPSVRYTRPSLHSWLPFVRG